MKLIHSHHTWSLKTFCGKGLIRPYFFICVRVCMCVCAYTSPRSPRMWPQAFLSSYFHVNKGINHFVLLAVTHLCIVSSVRDVYCISFLRKSTWVVSLFPHYYTSVQLPGLSGRSCDIAVRTLPEWVEGGGRGAAWLPEGWPVSCTSRLRQQGGGSPAEEKGKSKRLNNFEKSPVLQSWEREAARVRGITVSY